MKLSFTLLFMLACFPLFSAKSELEREFTELQAKKKAKKKNGKKNAKKKNGKKKKTKKPTVPPTSIDPTSIAPTFNTTTSIAPTSTIRCDENTCVNGACVDGSCQCNEGWSGPSCDADIDECAEGSSNCDIASEVCVNTFGTFRCDCTDDLFAKNDLGICVDMSQQLVIARDLSGGNESQYMDLFDPELILSISSEDATVVPGSATLSNVVPGLDGQPPVFKVEEGNSHELIIEGNYEPIPGGVIPPDLKARVHLQDGRVITASVDQVTGFFSLVIFDVPYGISPFILLFLSENYNEGSRLLRRSLASNQASTSMIGMAENVNECGPAFSLTLTWDQPTSDVDLHVYEPGGIHVYYNQKEGDNGSYLDYDDTEGYGPEHYIVPSTVFLGSNYTIQVQMFDYDQETDVDINWKLEASSFGKHLWSKSGTFHQGITANYSDFIEWGFMEEPRCEIDPCTYCGSILPGTSRRLAYLDPKCDSVSAPTNYQSLYFRTHQYRMDAFYCHWEYYSIDPLMVADLLNGGAACVIEILDDAERDDIISRLGNSLDGATAVNAGVEVYNTLWPKRPTGYVCRHHAIALAEVLQHMGFDASIKAAWSWTNAPHTWVEATIVGERYILDCYNQIYIKVNTQGSAPGCIYTSSTNKVKCTRDDVYAAQPNFLFECDTAVPPDALPLGKYYVGKATSSHNWRWYNLYKKRDKGGIWDYSTKIPTESCRGGFGFHEGPGANTASDGCISVTDNNCFTQVETFIDSFQYGYQPVRSRWECDGCFFGMCVESLIDIKMSSIPLYEDIVVISE